MANINEFAVRNAGHMFQIHPPRSPYPCISLPYVDYAMPNIIDNNTMNPRGRNTQHHRVSSESQIEEQPSWLDDLLNEPETPVQRHVHRRSSSDSFGSCNNNMVSVSSWGSQDSGPPYYNNAIMQVPFYKEVDIPFGKRNNFEWDSIGNSIPIKDNIDHVQDSFFILQEGNGVTFTALEDDTEENGPKDAITAVSDMKDNYSLSKSSSETDMKRTKQQFAQRSRVRKLRYIAELERSVQVLQIEGCGICAELEFFSHQNLILNMENKALKQRLESISQEHVIKCLEHEVLEREIKRLRSLYQQQHQPPSRRPSPRHRQANSFDLDKQFVI